MEAQETLLELKDLLNYDYANIYYHLIRVIMADMRLQQISSSDMPAIEYDDFESKLDLARVLILKD